MTKQQAELARVVLAWTVVLFVVVPLGVPGLVFKVIRERR